MLKDITSVNHEEKYVILGLLYMYLEGNTPKIMILIEAAILFGHVTTHASSNQ